MQIKITKVENKVSHLNKRNKVNKVNKLNKSGIVNK